MKRMGIVAVTLAVLALGNHPAAAQPASEPPASPPAASDAPAAQPAPPRSSTLPASPPSPVPRPPASSATPPASSFAFGRRPSRDEVSAAREACRQQANAQAQRQRARQVLAQLLRRQNACGGEKGGLPQGGQGKRARAGGAARLHPTVHGTPARGLGGGALASRSSTSIRARPNRVAHRNAAPPHVFLLPQTLRSCNVE